MKITDWLISNSPKNKDLENMEKKPKEKPKSPKRSPKDKKSEGGGGGATSSSKRKSSAPSIRKSDGVGPPSKPKKESQGASSSSSTPKGSKKSEAASSSKGASGTMTTVNGTHSTKFRQEVTLPQNKVKIIMKSSPEIDQVGADVLFLISKATELFIDHITSTAYETANHPKSLEYRHLAEMTQKEGNMEFLRDIIPMKMLARDALKEMAKQTELENKELLGD